VFCVYCTLQDVAARGLDLPHVHWIVQYNVPGKPVDYIHRVGRTARIGVTGNALLFVSPAEVDYITVLRQHSIELALFLYCVWNILNAINCNLLIEQQSLVLFFFHVPVAVFASMLNLES